jgi:2-amino-4-hydroxy-6-hydroxymethyldihydropteridine diphosphokinase
MRPRPAQVLIGLGSNVGDKAANIARAIALLTASGDVRLIERSRIYRSAPWGVADQDWFANACISASTKLSPRALLAACQSVEQAMHRVREQRWGPRVIDVDILDYDGETVREPDLVIPHPYIAERAFVLTPLKDVAPDFSLNGASISEMLDKLDASDVVAFTEK